MMDGRALGAALIALLAAGCGGDGPRPPFPDANLIILSLDTLRADGLSVYGGHQNVSPAIQRFAEQSIVFTQARANAPHTAPSHMSLFTSLYPSVHGVQNVVHVTDPKTGRRHPLILSLPESIPTLAEVLHSAGFRTVGLTDGGNLNPPHGFGRGFDQYTYDLGGVEAQVADGKTWIGDLNAVDAGRYFLFWHTYETHAPYVPPRPYIEQWAPRGYDGPMRARIDQLSELPSFREIWGRMKTLFWKDRDSFGWSESAFLRGLYDGEIRYTDHTLEQLFDAMEAAGVFEDSIVVLLSDHGEEFYEHGKWQHEQLFEECLRVPLMVRLPGGLHGGRRIDVPVGLIDVMPTVLDLLGVDPQSSENPAPLRMQGHSLAASLMTGTDPVPRPVISELRSDREGGPNYDWMVAVTFDGMKFVFDEYRGDPSGRHFRYLYDLAADPTEQRDLARSGGDRVAAFEKLYAGWKLLIESHGDLQQKAADLSPEQIEQLIQLGYLSEDEAEGR